MASMFKDGGPLPQHAMASASCTVLSCFGPISSRLSPSHTAQPCLADGLQRRAVEKLRQTRRDGCDIKSCQIPSEQNIMTVAQECICLDSNLCYLN